MKYLKQLFFCMMFDFSKHDVLESITSAGKHCRGVSELWKGMSGKILMSRIGSHANCLMMLVLACLQCV